jgi:predicted amidohydrolase YtcJ
MNESLLGQNNWLAISSDCPVSPVNQILNFYLSIGKVAGTITDPDGFIPMSREQALKAMTIWAAKAGFDDKKVGSIEVGKLADFVILDQDIMKVSEECIKSTKVLKTFIAGKLVYKKK